MMDPLVTSTVQRAEHLFGPDFAGQINDHAERHAQALKDLRKAVLGDQRRKVREIQHRILTSLSSRLVCLIRSLKKADGFTPERSRETAAGLNAWQDPGETVVAWLQPKTSGEGWRPICKFGPKRAALQTLCADILGARFGVDPSDYQRKGQGADRASDRIVTLVEEKGFAFFVLFDVKDFFRSVQQTSLQKALGLPEAVIRNCLSVGPTVPLSRAGDTTIANHEAFDRAVRQGLPQGSRASNLVASLLLGPALRKVASADRIVTHGDDVAVAARDEDEGNAMKEALSEMLASHPAGPFCLKRCEVRHVGDGIDFLKYRHRHDPFTGLVKRTPAAKSYWRFYRKVLVIAQTEPVRVALSRIGTYRRRWMDAFPRWHRTPSSKLLMLLQMKEIIHERAKGKWWRLMRGRSAGGW